MPTFAELTGRPTPSGLDGLSILPTLPGRHGQRLRAAMNSRRTSEIPEWNFPPGPPSPRR